MDGTLAARRWDEDYQNGRYAEEGAIPFVDTIVSILRTRPALKDGIGLYVGCGNGRNFTALRDAGLDLCGLDLSTEALRQLAGRAKDSPPRLVCSDFRHFSSGRRFDYVIAIQVLQHGTESDVAAYFKNMSDLLRPGGMLFLRVNSVSTEIRRRHLVSQRNADGGFTLEYQEGPKLGLPIHFYSARELGTLTTPAFKPLGVPVERLTTRPKPDAGQWAQWEAVWIRN